MVYLMWYPPLERLAHRKPAIHIVYLISKQSPDPSIIVLVYHAKFLLLLVTIVYICPPLRLNSPISVFRSSISFDKNFIRSFRLFRYLSMSFFLSSSSPLYITTFLQTIVCWSNPASCSAASASSPARWSLLSLECSASCRSAAPSSSVEACTSLILSFYSPLSPQFCTSVSSPRALWSAIKLLRSSDRWCLRTSRAASLRILSSCFQYRLLLFWLRSWASLAAFPRLAAFSRCQPSPSLTT